MWARLDYLPPPLDLCCWCLALSFPVRRGGLGLSSGLWWPCGFCCFFIWYSCVCGFVPIRFSSQSPLDKLQRVLTFLMVCCLVCPEGSADLFIYFCLFLLHVADTSFFDFFLTCEEFICRSRQTLLLGGRNRRQFDWYSFECTVGKKDLWWDVKTNGPLCEQKMIWGRNSEISTGDVEDLFKTIKRHELVTNRGVKIHRYESITFFNVKDVTTSIRRSLHQFKFTVNGLMAWF